MASFYDVVKRIAREQMEASQPATVMYGTVTKTSPLEVIVEQRFTIGADFLVVPEHMTPYSVMVGSQIIEIRRGFSAGDRLVLLRSPGGLEYVVLGRLP